MPIPSKHILLVDDEERVVSALRRRLRNDFSVLTATSGAEALETLEGTPDIAVIVADMQMPGMNGIELLREVHERFPHVRRLMLTGNADLETAVAAINDGKVDRFLRKPCEAAELSGAIDQALAEFAFHQESSFPSPIAPATAEPARKACDAFLAMVVRDLQTPLSEIATLEQAVKQHAPKVHDPSSFDSIVRLRSSGESMLRLIDRVLEFSRLRSEHPELDPIDHTDIIQVLSEEVERLRDEAHEMEISLQINSLRRTARVRANEEEVRLAFRELLSNAMKFSAGKGHVSVLVKCSAESVAVSIINGGWGVPPSVQEMLARPFWESASPTEVPSTQIGLGLARVATIAELNNARFTLEALAKGGSQAILAFDRAQEGNEAQVPTQLAG